MKRHRVGLRRHLARLPVSMVVFIVLAGLGVTWLRERGRFTQDDRARGSDTPIPRRECPRESTGIEREPRTSATSAAKLRVDSVF